MSLYFRPRSMEGPGFCRNCGRQEIHLYNGGLCELCCYEQMRKEEMRKEEEKDKQKQKDDQLNNSVT